MEDIKLIHGDSLQALKGYADNHFDVAVVDPPYGIEDKISIGGGSHTKTKTKFHNLYSENGKKWDIRPSKEYFTEVQRVSKNKVFFGGNYFAENLPVSRGWAVWDKQGQGMSSVNDELIWTSFDISIKTFSRCHGLDKGFMNKEGKNIHPTQKPIALYRWVLEQYTNENDLILDTHLGSGSIAIACHYMKRKLIGYEIDKDYYDADCKRFKEQTSQQALW